MNDAIMEEANKVCGECKAVLPLSEFFTQTASGKPFCRCKGCVRAYNRAYQKTHPKKKAPLLRRVVLSAQRRRYHLAKYPPMARRFEAIMQLT